MTDNNNLNVMKNNNGNSSTLLSSISSQLDQSETVSRDYSRPISSQHDSMTSSEELPSFSSSIDDMELRDLRRAKREADIRLVDREDQVQRLWKNYYLKNPFFLKLLYLEFSSFLTLKSSSVFIKFRGIAFNKSTREVHMIR